MDIVMPLLMALAIIDGCLGMDPKDIEWTPELKLKLFQIFRKTSPDIKDHSQRVLNAWNRENPSHKVSDGKALYKLILYMIDDREKRNKTEWNQIEWTREMQVLLLHIRHKVENAGGEVAKRIAAKWKLLYPQSNIHPSALEKYSRILQDEYSLRPTVEELMKAEEVYNRLIAESEEGREEPMAERHDRGLTKSRIKWSPQLKTDLWYIAQQLETVGMPPNLNLKELWDRMNEEYTMVTEKALLMRMKRIKLEGFVPKAIDVEDAMAKYKRILPIDLQDLKGKTRIRREDKIPLESAQPDSHKWHQSGHPTPAFEHQGQSSSHPKDYRYQRTMSGSNTAGATSSSQTGDLGLRDTIPSSSQVHQYELHQQHLDDPIYSPSYHGDFSYPSGYYLHPFTSSFNPYMYDPSHHPGEGSSSQPPGDSQGQHSPHP